MTARQTATEGKRDGNRGKIETDRVKDRQTDRQRER